MHGERTLAGRYRLGDVIGGGGMGVVYRATDLRLGRPVAVKLLSGVDGDQSSIARFAREARAAARVRHPGVVMVYDAGTENGTPFIVMQHVAGRSLELILRNEGPLDEQRAVGIVRQVASALAAAHRAGIVHRDVKPANVMVADDGSATVLDFGVARVETAATLTHTNSVLGTPAYMAPEQALGEPADARSDIYALGCVLYAALAGRPPFEAAAPASILHQQVYENPDPPSLARSGVSPALDALVMHMLAKSPDGRPQSAALVARWLEAEIGAAPAERSRPVAAAPATLAERSRPVALVPATLANGPPPMRPRRRRRRPAAGAALAVVVAGAVVAVAAASLVPGDAGADRDGAAHGIAVHHGASHHGGRPAAPAGRSVSATPAATGAGTGATTGATTGAATGAATGATTGAATGASTGASTGATGATAGAAPATPAAPGQSTDPAASNPNGAAAGAAGTQEDAVAAGVGDAGDGGGDGGGPFWRGHGHEDGRHGRGWWGRWQGPRGLPPGRRIVTLLLGGVQDGNSDQQGD
jgi:serine/threonine-protein kinase